MVKKKTEIELHARITGRQKSGRPTQVACKRSSRKKGEWDWEWDWINAPSPRALPLLLRQQPMRLPSQRQQSNGERR